MDLMRERHWVQHWENTRVGTKVSRMDLSLVLHLEMKKAFA